MTQETEKMLKGLGERLHEEGEAFIISTRQTEENEDGRKECSVAIGGTGWDLLTILAVICVHMQETIKVPMSVLMDQLKKRIGALLISDNIQGGAEPDIKSIVEKAVQKAMKENGIDGQVSVMEEDEFMSQYGDLSDDPDLTGSEYQG